MEGLFERGAKEGITSTPCGPRRNARPFPSYVGRQGLRIKHWPRVPVAIGVAPRVRNGRAHRLNSSSALARWLTARSILIRLRAISASSAAIRASSSSTDKGSRSCRASSVSGSPGRFREDSRPGPWDGTLTAEAAMSIRPAGQSVGEGAADRWAGIPDMMKAIDPRSPAGPRCCASSSGPCRSPDRARC